MYRLKKIYNLERNEQDNLKGASSSGSVLIPKNFKLKLKFNPFYENHIKPIIELNDRERNNIKFEQENREKIVNAISGLSSMSSLKGAGIPISSSSKMSNCGLNALKNLRKLMFLS